MNKERFNAAWEGKSLTTSINFRTNQEMKLGFYCLWILFVEIWDFTIKVKY